MAITQITSVSQTYSQIGSQITTAHHDQQTTDILAIISVLNSLTLFAFQALTDAATIVWNGALGFNAKVTLGGNRTLSAITNPVEGVLYRIQIIQDSTGSRTVTWNSAYDFMSAGTPTLSTGAGKIDIVEALCTNATTPVFKCLFRKSA